MFAKPPSRDGLHRAVRGQDVDAVFGRTARGAAWCAIWRHLPIREALDMFEEIAASGAIRPADRTKLGASGGIDTIASKFPALGGLADRPELPTHTSKA